MSCSARRGSPACTEDTNMTSNGDLPATEQQVIADELPPCPACGRKGLCTVHPKVIGTG